MQTDQGNEDERKSTEYIQWLELRFEYELTASYDSITVDNVKATIATATDRAPGVDGVKNSQIKALGEGDLQRLTGSLNDNFANHAIPDDWLDSHLAPVPKPEKDHTSIKGCTIVTMQNTVGKCWRRL